jgi:hypothetical protein
MADTGPAPLEPVLDIDDIQGDSLAGFRKNHELFAFFEITDPGRFRELLRSLIRDVSSLREVAAFNKVYRELRQRRGAHRTGLAALWINIAFTNEGLTKLAPTGSVEQFVDESFRLGMATRARGGLLGDVPQAGQLDATAGWRFGGTATPIDGVLLIAADNLLDLEARRDAIAKDWFGTPGLERDLSRAQRSAWARALRLPRRHLAAGGPRSRGGFQRCLCHPTLHRCAGRTILALRPPRPASHLAGRVRARLGDPAVAAER